MDSPSVIVQDCNTPAFVPYTNSSVDLRHWAARHDMEGAAALVSPSCAGAPLAPRPTSRVLIIYVGGTMGMRYEPCNGYSPQPGLLHRILQFHPYFSERACFSGDGDNTPADCDSSNTSLGCDGGNTPADCDSSNTSLGCDGGNTPAEPSHAVMGPWLTLPRSTYGTAVWYRVLEYHELLDSSNMGMQDWTRIAQDVQIHYGAFDGFVVVHGTDTMAYTGAALAFMLGPQLGKPVVLTGSQIPFADSRNDAADNLLSALTVAGHFRVPEVLVCFNHRCYRGCRVQKRSAVDLDAFDSPNLKPLISLGVSVHVEWPLVRPMPVGAEHGMVLPGVRTRLEPNVAAVRIFPGMTAATLRAFVCAPVRGVVLETFGTGNMPSNRPDLLAALHEAIAARSVVVVNVTQCQRGSVDPELYATGRQLLAIGVVPGYDLTVECALSKLSYLLGNYVDVREVRRLMVQSLCGELTLTRGHQHCADALDRLVP